jgi:hypothetical protein
VRGTKERLYSEERREKETRNHKRGDRTAENHGVTGRKSNTEKSRKQSVAQTPSPQEGGRGS